MTGINRYAKDSRMPLSGLITLILIAFLSGCSEIPDVRASELYRQGNEFYEKGQYNEASRTYERILEQGFHNGYVYYNLGNAYFKQQLLGRAILAYERAKRLMPRDPDIRSNLEIANLRIVDQVNIPDPWIGETLSGSVTVNEITVITSVAVALLALLCVIYILTERSNIRRLTYRAGMVMVALILICGSFLAIRIYDYSREEAVILIREAEVRSGPGDAYEQLFTLHEGTKTMVLEERGSWFRIQLPDGKGGWIAQEALAII